MPNATREKRGTHHPQASGGIAPRPLRNILATLAGQFVRKFRQRNLNVARGPQLEGRRHDRGQPTSRRNEAGARRISRRFEDRRLAMGLPGRDHGLHRDHRWQTGHHARLPHQVGRRGLAVGPPERADPLDALPVRRGAALVALRRPHQWGVLRPASCEALRSGTAFRFSLAATATASDTRCSAAVRWIAHRHLARLHRRLGADYNGPDWIPPQRPKWMRQRTYDRLVRRIEAGEERLDVVFTVGAQRILARIDRSEQRRGVR